MMTSMNLEHHFQVTTEWTGSRGHGTTGYRDYDRRNVIRASDKHAIAGSSAKPFHGDARRWNPEELLIAALSECHMLSYLHVAVIHGVVVTAYSDEATGTMELDADGGGHFTSVTLRPRVTISSGDTDLAREIHAEASRKCFIAASVNFPVHHEPEIVLAVE
jgi:organic hydroperoxide reductase OsmC/OhrA